mgnify:CR=1 FL=1
MADGKIIIDTLIDTTGVDKGMKSINGKINSGLSSLSNSVGKIVKTTAIALGTIGAAAIKTGMDFEEAMSKVKAISGATAEEMQALTEKAKEMGFKTKFSAKESAEAFYYMAQAGWKTQDMLDGIAGVMDLAAASGADLATTSDIVTDALTAFKMEASESARFADVLARTSADTNTDVLKMGETFKYVGSIAGAMGYSIEDVSVAIGLMASAGVKASQAGTSLRSIMTRMANPTEQSAAAMEALGLSITDANGNIKPFREVMEQLRKSMQGLSEDQKVAYAGMLAGKPGMSGLLAILNATDDEFNNLSNSIDNSNGAAQEMATTMQDNLKGKLEQLGGALESLGLEFYESVDNPLKDVVARATKYVEQLTNVFKSEGLKGLAKTIAQSLMDAMITMTTYFPKMAQMAVQFIQQFITGIQQNLPVITSSAVQCGSTFIQGMLQLLPQLIQLGISVLVQLGVGIAQELPNLLTKAANCVIDIANTMINNLPNIVNVGMKIIDSLVEGIGNIQDIFLNKGGELIVNFVDKIYASLPKVFEKGGEIITKLVEGLDSRMPQMLEKMPQIITAICNKLGEHAPEIIEAGMVLMGKLAIGLIKAIPQIITAPPRIIKAIMDGFRQADWGSIGKNIVKGIWNGIWSLAGWIGGKISGFAGDMVDKFKEKLGIHSPSRVMRDMVGKYIPQGISVGIEKEMPNLENDTVARLKALYTRMQSVINNDSMGLGNRSVGNSYINNIVNNTSPTIKNVFRAVLNVDGKDLAESIAPHQEVFDNYALGR